MPDTNYPIPANPTYNPNIRALQDADPASATNTFNPLIQQLIDNTHAVKLTTDTLNGGLTQAQSDIANILTQISALTGFDIAGASDTYANLPAAAGEGLGTLYIVQTDETHSGQTSVYEVVDTGGGVYGWSYLSEMGFNLDDYVAKVNVGVANGVAGLGADGKVPTAQLPALNYIPTSDKGAASGVATLDSGSKLTGAQLPDLPVGGFGYGTCTTVGTTAAKVGTLANFARKTGSIVAIKFSNANTAAAPTLNVNGTGANAIQYNGSAITAEMLSIAGYVAEFIFDGSYWQLLNPANGASGFTLLCTFVESQVGKNYTVTGGTGASGTVPAGLVVAIPVSAANTLYTITCNGLTKEVMTTGYFGLYPVAFNKTFADSSWSEIETAAMSGTAALAWNVGDEKDVTLTTGETLTFQIYDFNHDDLAAGGKAGITFGMKNLMTATKQMEATNTNANSFLGSAMGIWLNQETSGGLYYTLPNDLKAVIKSANKKTSAGSQSSTVNTQAMKIFLFSEVECFGTTTYSVAGEGSQYPVFTDNASRTKKLTNGTSSTSGWWERSPYASASTSFCYIISGGSAALYSASAAIGVCFGFCV
jgi:hypothetical protein